MTDLAKNLFDLPSDLGLLSISDEEFVHLRDFIHRNFGIYLSDQKRALVVGRVQSTLRVLGFKSFGEYYDYLLADKTGKVASELINRISTNHTFFFREPEHFYFLTTHALPQVILRAKNQNSNDLRFWCAGCSTGEEAYTIQILTMEYLGENYRNWNAGLLATDISQKVLDIAIKGTYAPERMAQVPQSLKEKYFALAPNKAEFQVQPSVVKEIAFRRFNLMNEFPFNKPFQIVFCRNVMIYFDQATRDALIERLHHHIEPNGFLFVGHSELISNSSYFEYLAPAVYRRRGA